MASNQPIYVSDSSMDDNDIPTASEPEDDDPNQQPEEEEEEAVAPHPMTEEEIKAELAKMHQDDSDDFDPLALFIPDAVPPKPVPPKPVPDVEFMGIVPPKIVPEVKLVSAIPAPRKPEGAPMLEPPKRSQVGPNIDPNTLPPIPDVPRPPQTQRAPKGANDYTVIKNALLAACTLEKIDFTEIERIPRAHGEDQNSENFHKLAQYAQGGIKSSDCMLRRIWSGCFFFKWNNKRYCLANFSRMAETTKTNKGFVKKMMKKWGYRESDKVFDRRQFDEYLSKWGFNPDNWTLYESKVF